MRMKRTMICLLAMTLAFASLPVNLLTGMAREVDILEEVQDVEAQEELLELPVISGSSELEVVIEESNAEDEILAADASDTEWMNVAESENNTEDTAAEAAVQELEAEAYPEIVIEEVAEVEEYNASVSASGSCGENVTWAVESDGTLRISGTGAMVDYGAYTSQPWYSCADYINEVVIEDGITAIGAHGFQSLFHLKKVSLPDTLQRIGTEAFWGCESLTGVVLPDSLVRLEDGAFDYCESLTEFVIPDRVGSDEGYLGSCLMHCVNLKKAVLPEGIESIPWMMFWECTSLESVTIPSTVTVIEEYAFGYCESLKEIDIPEGVTTIGQYAFQDCYSLSAVEIPDSVTGIDGRAFYNCKSLESIVFPDGITELSDYVLCYCTSLTSFEIPSSVTKIGEGAFAMTPLEEITIPESVTEIGAAAFGNCSSLQSVRFEGDVPAFLTVQNEGTDYENVNRPFENLILDCYYPLDGEGWTQTQPADCGGTLTMIPYGTVQGNLEGNDEVYAVWRLRAEDGAFVLSGTGAMQDFGSEEDYDAADRPWYQYKDLIKKVTIGKSITAIGAKAFYECANLTTVSLPDSLTFIGESAFELSGLTSVTIPDSVKELDSCAFATCTELKEVDLGEGLEVIGTCTFMECGSLSSIIIPASVTTIGASAFHSAGLETVVFNGDLPEVGNNAFSTIPALDDEITVQYQEDNETWSDLTQGSLGGSSEGGSFVYEAHVHYWDSGVQTTAPTCTAAGVKTFTCSDCENTKTESIAAKGHSWNQGVQTTAPICTAAGVKTYTCSSCGGTKTETLAAKGHSFGSWQVVSTATVFAAQKEKRVCASCKKEETRTTGSVLTPTVSLNVKEIPLQKGKSTSKVKVSGLAAGDYVVSWKSSKSSVAKVNKKTGKIKAKKVGSATITVTLASGKTASFKVNVQKTAVKTSKITLENGKKITLKKGKTCTLVPVLTPITSLEKVTYKSLKTKVATVSAKGVITAKKKGKATILVKAGSKTVKCKVTVK